jgi:hypothetical protein
VRTAVEKTARLLKLNYEIKTFKKSFTPIYVYYKTGGEELIPLYCNNNSQSDTEEVCMALRNMMFVLSFHPRHQYLKRVRKDIMQFS